VDPRVVKTLDAKVAEARRAGKRVTKERLVSDAVLTTYSDSATRLPEFSCEWVTDIDPYSNTALLDFLDGHEAIR
jgi:hypothetical protein